MNLPMSFFPYGSIRPFQDELIQRIYTSDCLLCQVPTGVGKSISALTAFLGDRQPKEKIFVLTRTKSQAGIFLKEMNMISRHTGIPHITIHLKSKKETCPRYGDNEIGYEEFVHICRMDKDCSFRKRFVENRENISSFAEKILSGEKGGLSEDGLEIPLEYGCPYLVNIELLKYAQVIIGAYHYMLNPSLRNLVQIKTGTPLEEFLVIMDEAHNLQSLDILGRNLSMGTLKLARKEINYDLKNFGAVFKGDDQKIDVLECLDPKEVEFLYNRGLEVLQRKILKGKKISHLFRMGTFFQQALDSRRDDNWVLFRQDNSLKLLPVFPSQVIRPLKDARKLLLMSGTLSPTEGYRSMLELDEAETYELPGIFPRENRRFFVLKGGLNTALKTREVLKDALWKKYAFSIVEISRNTWGKTLVFFPSYEIAREVGKYLDSSLEPKSAREIGDFIKSNLNDRKGIILAVSGGKLSEGVEFTLNGNGIRKSVIGTVIIAGLPFPRPDFYLNLKKGFYESRFGPGQAFFFLSLLPMINKVLQAAGRAIRGEKDRAAIVFLDDRLEYYSCFPEEIKSDMEPLTMEEIIQEIEYFHGINQKQRSFL